MIEPGNTAPNDRRGFVHESRFGRWIGREFFGSTGTVPVGYVPPVGGTPLVNEPVTTKRFPATAHGDLAILRGTLYDPTRLEELIRGGITLARQLLDMGLPAEDPLTMPTDRADPCWPLKTDPATNRCSAFIGTRAGADAFQATTGAFGMPAMIPQDNMRLHHTCPKGMVLGEDMLCYPRAVLRRDSRFRKWKPGARPILTGGQRKAIQKAKKAVTTARDAISGFGVTVKKKC
jgi:hypothetical protein